MMRGTPRRSEQNQSLDEEIGKIPEQLLMTISGGTGMKPFLILTYRRSSI
jgi:hypothetical protein